MFKSLMETYRLNKLSFIFLDGVLCGVGVGTVLGPTGPNPLPTSAGESLRMRGAWRWWTPCPLPCSETRSNGTCRAAGSLWPPEKARPPLGAGCSQDLHAQSAQSPRKGLEAPGANKGES